MAKASIIQKSFRTLVGVVPAARTGRGSVYVLDSNNTSKYYAFFGITCGPSQETEKKAYARIETRTAPICDIYRGGENTRPGATVKDLMSEIWKAKQESGLPAEVNAPAIIAMIRDGNLSIGRINSCPAVFMRDKKVRDIFKPLKTTAANSLQIENISVSEGDMLVIGSPKIMDSLTKLEIRNTLVTEHDPDRAAQKLLTIANKNSQTDDSKIMVVSFRQLRESATAALKKRNTIIISLIAASIMLFFVWGDISRTVRSSSLIESIKSNRIVKKMHQAMTSENTPGKPQYIPQLAYSQLRVPYDISIDTSGNLYIVDDSSEKIIKYTPDTDKREEFGSDIDLSFPTGIAVTGDRVYVADFSRSVNRLHIYNRKDGSHIASVPGRRNRSVSFSNPKAVAASSDGQTIYVCDRGNDRIVKLKSDGTFVKILHIPSNLEEPNGLAVAKNGDIYITFKPSGRVGKFPSGSSTFTPMSFTQLVDNVPASVTFVKPAGIAADSKGTIYIADTGNQRIVISGPDGKIIDIIDSAKIPDLASHYPMSVKLSPDEKSLYIVGSSRYSFDFTCDEKCTGKIWKISI